MDGTNLETCVFCRIVRGEIPAEVVYEEADVVAFRDLSPQAPQHFLLIPKRHIPSVDDLDDDDQAVIARLILAARDVARSHGLAERGYRVVTNIGDDGGQSVAHLHFHLLGGRSLSWPPG